jgi:hypothetical protein
MLRVANGSKIKKGGNQVDQADHQADQAASSSTDFIQGSLSLGYR